MDLGYGSLDLGLGAWILYLGRFSSVLVHFLGSFGSLFGTESDPKTSADRFSDKKSDSEQTLVITMDLNDFTGPKRPKKRLWG